MSRNRYLEKEPLTPQSKIPNPKPSAQITEGFSNRSLADKLTDLDQPLDLPDLTAR